jgi:hypothetical protein
MNTGRLWRRGAVSRFVSFGHAFAAIENRKRLELMQKTKRQRRGRRS